MEKTNNPWLNPTGGSLANRIVFSILLLVTFLVPIFFVPVSFVSTQFGTSLLFGIGVIIAMLVYIISSLVAGSIELPVPAKFILGIMAVVPVIYTLAGIANGFSRMSFLGYTFDQGTVGFILVAFSYMFLVSVLFRQKSRIMYSYIAFVLSAVLSILFLVVRILFGAKVLSFGMFTDVTSTVMGTWNNTGLFFGITTLMSLLAHDMLFLGRKMKMMTVVMLIISLFFLAIVGLGSIWIVLAVCSLLFIFYKMFSLDSTSYGMPLSSLSLKQKMSRIPFYSAMVFVIAVIFSIWGGSIGGFLSAKLNITNVEVRPSLSVTLDIAKNTIMSRPLFGSGPNSFVTQWLSFKPDDITSTIFWNTDFTNGIGLIPTFAVTTGIAGVLSWLIFLGFYAYFGFRSVFSRVEDVFLKYAMVSSFFISLFLWIMTFLYVPSTVIFILAFFFSGLFLASIYATGLLPVVPKVFSYSPRAGFTTSLLMVALFVGFTSLGYGLTRNFQSLWYFQKSYYALNSTGDIQTAEDYMAKAITTVPQDIYYRALSEIEIYKMNAILQQDPKKVDQKEIQKQFSAALSTGIKAGMAATSADPSSYLNWIALARVYEVVSDPSLKIDGAYESATFSYNEAMRRNPKNPGIIVLLSRLAVTHQDLKTAASYALQAIQLKRNYTDAYFLLAQIQVAGKDVKSAIESVTAATVIDPTNSGVFFQLGLLKFNTQDFNGAVEAFQKAIEITPNYANAQYYLGLSYEALGQHEKALAIFTALKESNPDSKEVDAILTALQSGKSIFGGQAQTPSKTATKPPVTDKTQE